VGVEWGGGSEKDLRTDAHVCDVFVLARYPLANIKIILFFEKYEGSYGGGSRLNGANRGKISTLLRPPNPLLSPQKTDKTDQNITHIYAQSTITHSPTGYSSTERNNALVFPKIVRNFFNNLINF